MNGGPPAPEIWDFWLPFGIGLGGACFKQGGRVFYYVRASSGNPEFFLNIPGRSTSAVLVSVPLDHPSYDLAIRIEDSRQCIGVINIASESEHTKLQAVTTDKDTSDELWWLCQDFCRAVWEHLMSVRRHIGAKNAVL
jgi:hypothetical protein